MTLLLPDDPTTTDADNDPTPLDVEELDRAGWREYDHGNDDYGFVHPEHGVLTLDYLAGLEAKASPKPDPLKLSLNLEHKMGLPDFSSVAASMHISGITADHTEDEIAALVERGRVAWGVMGPKVTAQVRAARAEKGWT